MADLTPFKSNLELIPAGTSNAPGAVTRSAGQPVNLGVSIFGRITNGSTGPTVAARVIVYAAAPVNGVMPSVPSSGALPAGWVPIGELFGASTINNAINNLIPVTVGQNYSFFFVEISSNTVASVSSEIWGSRTDKIVST